MDTRYANDGWAQAIKKNFISKSNREFSSHHLGKMMRTKFSKTQKLTILDYF
jgi:hypothetical protein